MQPTLEQLKARVRERGRKFDLFYWMDIFMKEYHLTPEQFLRMNIPLFYLLQRKMQERYEEESKRYKNAGKKGRGKR